MAARIKIPTPSAPLRAGSCAKDAQGWGTPLGFRKASRKIQRGHGCGIPPLRFRSGQALTSKSTTLGWGTRYFFFHHKHSVRRITDFYPAAGDNGIDLRIRTEVCPSPRRRPSKLSSPHWPVTLCRSFSKQRAGGWPTYQADRV